MSPIRNVNADCIYSTLRNKAFCNPAKQCPCDAFIERTPIGVIPKHDSALLLQHEEK